MEYPCCVVTCTGGCARRGARLAAGPRAFALLYRVAPSCQPSEMLAWRVYRASEGFRRKQPCEGAVPFAFLRGRNPSYITLLRRELCGSQSAHAGLGVKTWDEGEPYAAVRSAPEALVCATCLQGRGKQKKYFTMITKPQTLSIKMQSVANHFIWRYDGPAGETSAG